MLLLLLLISSICFNIPFNHEKKSRSAWNILYSRSHDIDVTREAIVQIIEQSWLKVLQLIPRSTLDKCEFELREATSLLVLASVRKSALASPTSRQTVEQMFEDADVNQDGQVTFKEWFQWLSDSKETDYHRISYEDKFDPLIDSLGSVLSHAVYTVKVAARVDSDPAVLTAAFIAGGMLSGALDREVCRAMLGRLSPRTRELAAIALSLESASLYTSSQHLSSEHFLTKSRSGSEHAVEELYNRFLDHLFGSTGGTSTRAGSVWSRVGFADSSVESELRAGDNYLIRRRRAELLEQSSSNDAEDSSSGDGPKAAESSLNEHNRMTQPTYPRLTRRSVMQTIDFSSVPVLTAPPIAIDSLATTTEAQVDLSYLPVEGISDGSEGEGEGNVSAQENDEISNITRPQPEWLYQQKQRDELEEVLTAASSSLVPFGDAILSLDDSQQRRDNVELAVAAPDLSALRTIVTSDSYKIALFQPLRVEDTSRQPANAAAMHDVDKHEETIFFERSTSHWPQSLLQALSNDIPALPVSTYMTRQYYNVSYSVPTSKVVEEVFSRAAQRPANFSSPAPSSGTVEEVLSEAAVIFFNIQQCRAKMTDLGDRPAAEMRRVIAASTRGQRALLALALALRASRLQHAFALPRGDKERVALESLQIWAPLSFQSGMSLQSPELEVHSYALLFPHSFSSFLRWLDVFRPLARRLLKRFRSSLRNQLESDPVLPCLATAVKIQSRIKAPSSTFKKMIKSSKSQDQLHDILGLRVIIAENLPPLLPSNHDVNSPDAADWESPGEVEVGEEVALWDEEFPPVEESSEDAVWRVHDIVAYQMCGPSSEEPTEQQKFLLDSDTREDQEVETNTEWVQNTGRFKDYVSKPKPSGYQSLHLTLTHRPTGMLLEVQIRSLRMHLIAEYGSAAHSNYKALILPESVDSDNTASPNVVWEDS